MERGYLRLLPPKRSNVLRVKPSMIMSLCLTVELSAHEPAQHINRHVDPGSNARINPVSFVLDCPE